MKVIGLIFLLYLTLPAASGQCLFYQYPIDTQNTDPNFMGFGKSDNKYFSTTFKNTRDDYLSNTITSYDSCGNIQWTYEFPDSHGYNKLYHYFNLNENFYLFGDNPGLGWVPIMAKFSPEGKLLQFNYIGDNFNSIYQIIQQNETFLAIGKKRKYPRKPENDAFIQQLDTLGNTLWLKEFGFKKQEDEFLHILSTDDTYQLLFQTGKEYFVDSASFHRNVYIFRFSNDFSLTDSFLTELPTMQYSVIAYNDFTKEYAIEGILYVNSSVLNDTLFIIDINGKIKSRRYNSNAHGPVHSIQPFRDGWVGMQYRNLVFLNRNLQIYKSVQVLPGNTFAELSLSTFWDQRVICLYGKAKDFLPTPEDDNIYSPLMIMIDSSGENIASRTSWPISAPEFTLYPNPTSGSFKINCTSNQKTPQLLLEVFNPLGQRILFNTVYGDIEDEITGTPGIYLVRVSNTSLHWSKTFRVLKY